MRNAVIRKKHLRTLRMIDDFIRMPRRIIVPELSMRSPENWSAHNARLWATDTTL